MNDDLASSIRKNIADRPTDELLQIYESNDLSMWSAEAIEVTRQILVERGIRLPVQRTGSKADIPKGPSITWLETLAGGLSGAIHGAVVGVVAVWCFGGDMAAAVVFGPLVGLVVGWQTASVTSIRSAAAFGPILAIGLCVLEIIRRLGGGRMTVGQLITEISRDFGRPEFSLGFVGVIGAAALMGCTLVGFRRAIVRLFDTNRVARGGDG